MHTSPVFPVFLLTAALFVARVDQASAQHYHDAKFIGGDRWIHLYDVQAASASTLVTPGQRSAGHRMDRDNRHVVFTDTNGLYRFDPANPYSPPQPVAVLPIGHFPERITVGQDGDYIVNVYRSLSPAHHFLLKISYGGTVRTIFSTLATRALPRNLDHVCIDIDTGHYLVSDNAQAGNAPVYEVSDAGAVSTWNAGQKSPVGSLRGWDGFRSMCQNHRNGFLEAPEGQYVYQLQPGTRTPTTLATLPTGVDVIFGASGFDLQSAARPRWFATGTTLARKGTLAYIIDRTSFAVTSITVMPSYWFNNDLDFYRGRHLQTVKTGSGRWDIRISCPRFPGRTYNLVAGLSGVRPGVALPDGRRVLLNPDPLSHATLNNLLPGIFNPGPLVLDARGDAFATLDVSRFGSLGIPLWLAVAVLDPAAPWGVAYLPDTRVLRL